MSDSSCIFCKIIAGEIPGKFVHRDDEVVVIEDVNPQAPKHLLVMPVKHVPNLAAFVGFESPELIAKLFSVAGQLGREQSANGNRAVINTGPEGGQTVDHLHIHVLAGRQMHWPPG
ncbi:MAG TPA: HIT domain-containing protein [Candidatus Baltobacteraceae bacterium]|nr:HIT domain-containing protein [Candidatus Baltobacteraceae bacterium]